MASQRKRWFRVADSILREPWERDVKCTMVLLVAYLNGRWARDGLTAEEACKAVLSPGALAEITGRAQLVHSRRALRALGAHVGLAIREQDQFTEIHWPKLAEFQVWESKSGAKAGLKTPPPRPRPATRVRDPQKEKPSASTTAPAARALKRCPGFPPEEREQLRAYVRSKRPDLLPDFDDILAEILAHEFSRPKSDWLATARGWFRRQPQPVHARGRPPPSAPPAQDEFELPEDHRFPWDDEDPPHATS